MLVAEADQLEENVENQTNRPDHPQSFHGEKLNGFYAADNEYRGNDPEGGRSRGPAARECSCDGIFGSLPPKHDCKRKENEPQRSREGRLHFYIGIVPSTRIGPEPLGEKLLHGEGKEFKTGAEDNGLLAEKSKRSSLCKMLRRVFLFVRLTLLLRLLFFVAGNMQMFEDFSHIMLEFSLSTRRRRTDEYIE